MAGNVVELRHENFSSKTAKGNWVVDFWAEWCGPCKILSPIFSSVADEMKGKFNFGKVDVDAETDLAQGFDVMSIPTILFIKDGELVDRSVGLVSKEELASQIKKTF